MNYKILGLALLACLFSACNNPTAIEFDVQAANLQNGVFVVKDDSGQAIYGANISNGKCHIKDIITQPGFYHLDIQQATGNDKHSPFEVYLEPGVYHITANKDLDYYPTVICDSKKQQELSTYYPILDRHNAALSMDERKLNEEQDNAAKANDALKYRRLTLETESVRQKSINGKFDALNEYVKAHPESELSAHFMSLQNYEDAPAKYNGLFDKLSNTAKTSTDGIEVGKKLQHLLSLLPGAQAPQLSGSFYDGRSMASVLKGKKIFLIDFWRAGSPISRTNHDDIKRVFDLYSAKGFEVISVSLDSKPLWWKTAVTDDHLPWPQLSDLKGDDSANATNYCITTLPTYYIVDAQWHVIAGDVAVGSINSYVMEYLDKHH